MNIYILICGIIILMLALSFMGYMIWKTPKNLNFSTKALLRYAIFGIIGSAGGILLIMFAFIS